MYRKGRDVSMEIKKRKRNVRMAWCACMTGVCVLWSVFYPDLYLMQDVCCIAKEAEGKTATRSTEQNRKVTLEEIGNAKPGQIEVKSRFLEWLTEDEH